MALVVLLKGVNVGGHRTFRPSVLAKELDELDVVSIGAAGTFVVRNPISQVNLRAELMRRLPFQTDVMICRGSQILRLASGDPFAGHASAPAIVQFVSVMAKRRTPPAALPLDLPGVGEWSLRVLACQDRFVLGLYRREMKSIGYLGRLEKVFGVSLTTRNWNTILAVARALRD
ncbi:MAG: DUF1697 domain-containing protein [Longimicrobiales bacterium]